MKKPIRNQNKAIARQMMDPLDIVNIEKRNLIKFGDPLGPPTSQEMFIYIQKQNFDAKIYMTDEQIWEKIVNSSTQTDPVLNALLGLKQ